MPLSRSRPQSSNPTLDVRLHILPADLLVIPHLLHAHGTPIRSFVSNFLDLLWVQARQVSRSAVDTAGITRTTQLGTGNFNMAAPIATITYGIALGNGGFPPTPSDYTLQTQIAEGTGPDQLNYAAVAFVDPYVVGDITYAAILRIVTNNSGASIYINEIGLKVRFGTTAGTQSFLIARDILISTITLTPGGSRQFTYTFATET